MEMVLGVPKQKNHLTPVNWKLHRKTNLFPILTVHFPAPLFKPVRLHSRSLPRLLRHNNVWLLPDFSEQVEVGGGWRRFCHSRVEGKAVPQPLCLAERSDLVSPTRWRIQTGTWELKFTRPLWFWDDLRNQCCEPCYMSSVRLSIKT